MTPKQIKQAYKITEELALLADNESVADSISYHNDLAIQKAKTISPICCAHRRKIVKFKTSGMRLCYQFPILCREDMKKIWGSISKYRGIYYKQIDGGVGFATSRKWIDVCTKLYKLYQHSKKRHTWYTAQCALCEYKKKKESRPKKFKEDTTQVARSQMEVDKFLAKGFKIKQHFPQVAKSFEDSKKGKTHPEWIMIKKKWYEN